MGRPIKSKFFGNRNNPYDNEQTGGTSGLGGEKVAAVAITNSGTNYSEGTTVAFGAPNITGGVQATASLEFGTGANRGKIMKVTVTNAGSGYTSVPTLTVTKATTVNTVGTATNASYTLTNLTSVAGIYIGMQADAGWGMQASNYVASIGTNSVTLTKTMNASTASLALVFSDQGASFAKTVTTSSNQINAIAFSSRLLAKDGGGASVAGGDILKQESSRRYLVKNSNGTGQCRLVAAAPAAGQMTIIATDANDATYYVIKLTAHKATLVNIDGTPLFDDNTAVGWTFVSPAPTGYVTIANN